MTKYLLDTNIASLIIKGRDTAVIEHLASKAVGDVVISVITEAEILYGLAKCGHPPKLQSRILSFLNHVPVIPWDSNCADTYAELRCVVEAKGFSLSHNDMLIAAHAIAVGAVLISRDKAFARVMTNLETWEAL